MNFTKEELYWIERTADLEGALALDKFFKIVSIPKANITDEELKGLTKYSTELIELYSFLREIRNKLEKERNGNI
jgi:hypothetical protein